VENTAAARLDNRYPILVHDYVHRDDLDTLQGIG
jgi:hypothetical protein